MEKISQITGLLEGAASRIKDNRTQSMIDYNKLALLKQCVLLTATGNPDTNDADRHRLDPSLIECLSGEMVASQPTVARFLNKITRDDLEALSDWFLDFYMRHHQVKRRRIYLYCDGTAVEAHGTQEGAIYRGGKYMKNMYFPLTVFDQDGWLMAVKLRRGNQSEATTITDLAARIVGKLRERWSNAEIVLVVDGAFKSSKLFNWCEKNKVLYLAGYANTAAVKSKLKDERRIAEQWFWKEHGEPRFMGPDGDEKAQEEHARIRTIEDPKKRTKAERELESRRVRLIGEATHKATTWPKEDPDRRMIFRVDYTDKGLDTRCLLTNFTAYTADQLYQMYCQRGTSEQWIGELKNCFNLRLNSQSFRANQFRLYIHGMAYLLLWLLRSHCSDRFQRCSLETIRKTFVEIPVAVTFKKRRTLWELSDRYPHQTEFLRVTRKLQSRAS